MVSVGCQEAEIPAAARMEERVLALRCSCVMERKKVHVSLMEVRSQRQILVDLILRLLCLCCFSEGSTSATANLTRFFSVSCPGVNDSACDDDPLRAIAERKNRRLGSLGGQTGVLNTIGGSLFSSASYEGGRVDLEAAAALAILSASSTPACNCAVITAEEGCDIPLLSHSWTLSRFDSSLGCSSRPCGPTHLSWRAQYVQPGPRLAASLLLCILKDIADLMVAEFVRACVGRILRCHGPSTIRSSLVSSGSSKRRF